MNSRVFSISGSSLVLALWFALAPQLLGSDIGRISGSYQLVQAIKSGPQNRVRIHIHLANRGEHDLNIRRLALWDLPHPSPEGMRSCALLVRAGASIDTTQEFTVPRTEYQSWQRGNGPRLILEVLSPSGHATSEAVQLNAAAGRKAN